MTDQQPHYLAYMLRLWEARTGGEQVWRASLESPHTGERHGFASLQVLFTFLEQQTKSQTESIDQPGNSNEPGPAEGPANSKQGGTR